MTIMELYCLNGERSRWAALGMIKSEGIMAYAIAHTRTGPVVVGLDPAFDVAKAISDLRHCLACLENEHHRFTATGTVLREFGLDPDKKV